MTGADGVTVRTAGEQFDGVLADRLQHPEPFVAVPHQTLVHERLKMVDIRAGDLLRRVDATTALEHGETREQLHVAFIKELAGPLDRCAQRLLSWLATAIAAEQIEAVRQPRQDLSR